MPKAAATPLLVISRPCPQMPGMRTLPGQLSRRRPTGPRPSGGPWPTDRWTPRSRAAAALSMSRREMLGKGQVAAPLMAQRATYGACIPAHRRFQPGAGVGVQLAGLRLSGKPHRPPQRQFGHETLVPGSALTAAAAPCPRQHCAVRRQRGRQVAPCGHVSTVRQRFLRLVPRDHQKQPRRTSSPAPGARDVGRFVAGSERQSGVRTACI
jgi:hypothetical protein